MQVETDIADRRLAQRRQVSDFQHDIPRCALFFRETLAECASDHGGDNVIHRQPFEGLCGDPLAVTQNGYLITETENLFHFVGDINDAAAAIFQLADNGKQMIDFFFGQGGGRLIHDHNFGVIGKRFGDFDHLHLRDGQIADFFPRIDIDIQFIKDGLCVFQHLVLIDKKTFGGIATQPHVVHHRALKHQVQLLMHHGHAVFQRLF